MRYSNEHKRAVFKKLISEATTALWTSGPRGAGVGSLMARVGKTHGGFYAYFASKEQLIARTIGRMFAQSHVRLGTCGRGKGPAAALSAYIDRYLSEEHKDSPGRGCAIPAIASEAARMDDKVRLRFTAGSERFHRSLTEQFLKMGKKQVDAEELAMSLITEMTGVILVARACYPAKKTQKMLVDAKLRLKRRFELE